ncbi:hypothetical protein TorRG33x02_010750 [Trema orientale]|uniref:Uncharacterized protein n=1 Tax=Trema orientale TaxID=63057 RepID=A0A2P5FZ07_TREOI|nr:hypothetical protein TorRG33x02_010750 [Trema orientale]
MTTNLQTTFTINDKRLLDTTSSLQIVTSWETTNLISEKAQRLYIASAPVTSNTTRSITSNDNEFSDYNCATTQNSNVVFDRRLLHLLRHSKEKKATTVEATKFLENDYIYAPF